jgi:excisionase family DNA binding protein
MKHTANVAQVDSLDAVNDSLDALIAEFDQRLEPLLGARDRRTQFLSTAEVTRRVGLSRFTIARLVRAKDFPAPRRVGLRHIRWLSSELDEWMRSRQVATAPDR